jgi:uncharacterized membrane protein YqjE
MAEAPNPQNGPAGDAGLVAHTREFFASLADYFRARLQLAGIESKEAFVHYFKLLVCLVLALVVAVFGYLFLCIGAVVLIADLLNVAWPWVMVAAALLHFGITVACVLIAKAKLAEPMFGATLQEFRRDKQWLSTRT